MTKLIAFYNIAYKLPITIIPPQQTNQTIWKKKWNTQILTKEPLGGLESLAFEELFGGDSKDWALKANLPLLFLFLGKRIEEYSWERFNTRRGGEEEDEDWDANEEGFAIREYIWALSLASYQFLALFLKPYFAINEKYNSGERARGRGLRVFTKNGEVAYRL